MQVAEYKISGISEIQVAVADVNRVNSSLESAVWWTEGIEWEISI